MSTKPKRFEKYGKQVRISDLHKEKVVRFAELEKRTEKTILEAAIDLYENSTPTLVKR